MEDFFLVLLMCSFFVSFALHHILFNSTDVEDIYKDIILVWSFPASVLFFGLISFAVGPVAYVGILTALGVAFYLKHKS